jgi:hypothetical protein
MTLTRDAIDKAYQEQVAKLFGNLVVALTSRQSSDAALKSFSRGLSIAIEARHNALDVLDAEVDDI